MTMRKLSFLLGFASLAALAGCSAGQPSAESSAAASSTSPTIAGAIDRAMDKASIELATKNITVSDRDDSEPKAEITPQGDFLIAGKSVPLTSAQRAEMLDYRGQMVEIARQGLAIGKEGAKLGVDAATAAIAGIFSGESKQQIRQRVASQTSGIRQAAAKICDRLPALMETQQKLAADVPAFKPYADLMPAKIADCRRNALKRDDH